MAIDAGSVKVPLVVTVHVARETRVNYECSACGTAYTEQQYDRESALGVCGRCSGSLDRVELAVLRRERV